MTDNRSERFCSKGFKGVTVTKGKARGKALLSERGKAKPLPGHRVGEVIAMHAAPVRTCKGVGKTELVELVAESAGLPRGKASKAVDGVMQVITTALASGDTVRLVGFGTFRVVKIKSEKRGTVKSRNSLLAEGLASPQFKPGKHLKDAVN